MLIIIYFILLMLPQQDYQSLIKQILSDSTRIREYSHIFELVDTLPSAIVTDSHGSIYIAEANSRNLFVYTQEGVLTTSRKFKAPPHYLSSSGDTIYLNIMPPSQMFVLNQQLESVSQYHLFEYGGEMRVQSDGSYFSTNYSSSRDYLYTHFSYDGKLLAKVKNESDAVIKNKPYFPPLEVGGNLYLFSSVDSTLIRIDEAGVQREFEYDLGFDYKYEDTLANLINSVIDLGDGNALLSVNTSISIGYLLKIKIPSLDTTKYVLHGEGDSIISPMNKIARMPSENSTDIELVMVETGPFGNKVRIFSLPEEDLKTNEN
jgi:hypothetical protein